VVNRTWFKYYSTKGFEFDFELKARYTFDYNVEVL
jgi:hypothetical protein